MKILILSLALFVTVECSKMKQATITKKAPLTSPNLLHSVNVNPETQCKPIAIHSDECPTLPCELYTGQQLSFQFDFIPEQSHNGMTVKVFHDTNKGKAPRGHVQVPVYIEKGQEYTLTMPFFVSPALPVGPTEVYIDATGTDTGLYEFGGSLPIVIKPKY